MTLEDIYFKEALLRTGKRNKYFEEKKYFKAYKENEILEKYYKPFLIYFSEQWTEVQKAICLKKIGKRKNLYYKSKAFSFIYTEKKIRVLIYSIVIILLFHLLAFFLLFSRKPYSHFSHSSM